MRRRVEHAGSVCVDRASEPQLESAVDLRLGENRARQFQDLVDPAQLLELAFTLLHALRLGSGHTVANTGIDLVALDLVQPRLGTQPIFGIRPVNPS